MKIPALSLLLLVSACGGGGETAPFLPTAPPVQAAQTLLLKADVMQAAPATAAVNLTATAAPAASVSWQLASGSPGKLETNSGATVRYLPPAAVDVPTAVTLLATAGTLTQKIQFGLFPDPGLPRLEYLAGHLHGTGDLDATGPFARFNDITSTLMDAQGRLWITDGDLVRRIDAKGSVETLSAHDGTTVEGRLPEVRFKHPYGLSADPLGNIWLLDAAGIHKIDTAGRVSNVPVKVNGALVSLFDATAGVEREPRIAVDAGGTLYVMEYDRVRRMAPGGELLPYVGARVANPGLGYLDAQGTAARFSNLHAIIVDSAGNLFLNDATAGTMRRVDVQGNVTTFVGKLNANDNVDGTGSDAHFASLYSDILRDADGNMYVYSAIFGGTRVRKITSAGVVSSVATFLSTPVSFARDASGNFYFNFRDAVTTITPSVSLNMLPFSGVLYLSRIDGPWVPPGADPSAGRIVGPTAIAADNAGNIYVVDNSTLTAGPGNGAVSDAGLMLSKISPAGVVTSLAVQGNWPTLAKTRRYWFGRADAETGRPIARASGIAVDKAGNFYISEQQSLSTDNDGKVTSYGGGSIVKITPEGDFSVVAGKYGETGTIKDGKGEEARFNAPAIVGFDADDNLYVKDYMAMRKISPAGEVTTIATAEADLPLMNKPTASNGAVISADGARRAIMAGSGANAIVVAGGNPRTGILPGSLPGAIDYPHHLIKIGPRTFAFISGGAVMKLVLP